MLNIQRIVTGLLIGWQEGVSIGHPAAAAVAALDGAAADLPNVACLGPGDIQPG